MTTIDREVLLQKLEQVKPGLNAKDALEQSSSAVFTGTEIITFNDEICCRVAYESEIKGAVQAAPLIALLHKLPEETLTIRQTEGELRIKGKRRTAGIRMESEIALAIDDVEVPKKWRSLPEEFTDAIELIHECCSKDASLYILTCIHITPTGLEATDNYQLARYDLDVPTKSGFLVRKDSIKHITGLNMTHISETTHWVHFKNRDSLIMSCRRTADSSSFPEIAKTIKAVKGVKMVFPQGMVDSLDKAEVFSAESTEENTILIELIKGKLRLTGEGTLGWYSEIKAVDYTGPGLKFRASPSLMLKLLKRNKNCQVTESRLKAESERFVFVTCLGKVK